MIKLGWPPQSPDISPTESAWRYINTILGKRRHRIKTVKDMERVRPEIKGNFLLKLNTSMPRRLHVLKMIEER